MGYRINSKQATQFRIWATNILKEYLLEGYALDKDRFVKQQVVIKALEKTLALYKKAQSNSLNQEEASGLLSFENKW